MIARPRSWSRPADAGAAGLAVLGVLAAVVFLLAWALLHLGFYDRGQIVDTPAYQRYGDAMADGEVPYRDFRPEYPPLALPASSLPTLVVGRARAGTTTPDAFEVLMAAWGSLRSSSSRSRSRARCLARPAPRVALALFAASRRSCSARSSARASTSGRRRSRSRALAALVRGRDRLGAAALGLAVAAKLYAGRARAARARVDVAAARAPRGVPSRASLAVVAACFLPFVVARRRRRRAQLSAASSRDRSRSRASARRCCSPPGRTSRWSTSHGSQNIAGAPGPASARSPPPCRSPRSSGSGSRSPGAEAERRAARPLRGRRRVRVRRVREGALAAVPASGSSRSCRSCAAAAGSPPGPARRSRSCSRSSGSRTATGTARCASTRPSSWLVLARDLVLVALLAVLAVRLPGSGLTHGTGRGSARSCARRRASQSTTTPSIRTSPSAGLGSAPACRCACVDRERRLDPDHGVVRAGHARVGDRRRAARQHPGVGRLHVRVRAEHGGDAAVEPAGERRPSRSSPRRGSRRRRSAPARRASSTSSSTTSNGPLLHVEEEPAHQVDHRDRRPVRRGLRPRARGPASGARGSPAGSPARSRRGTARARRRAHVWLPSVITSAPAREDPLGELRGQAAPVGGVLAVHDAEVDAELVPQAREALLDRAAAGRAEDVGDEEEPQGSASVAAGRTSTDTWFPASCV